MYCLQCYALIVRPTDSSLRFISNWSLVVQPNRKQPILLHSLANGTKQWKICLSAHMMELVLHECPIFCSDLSSIVLVSYQFTPNTVAIIMFEANNGSLRHALISIRLINRTDYISPSDIFQLQHNQLHPHNSIPVSDEHLTIHSPVSTRATNSISTFDKIVPVPSTTIFPEYVNTTNNKVNQSNWWYSVIQVNPDVVLAFSLIIFYAIFLLFIFFIVIRIVFTIIMTGNRLKMSTSSEGLSDDYDETSSRIRVTTSVATRSRRYQQEMTSFAIERTNSPSIIDES